MNTVSLMNVNSLEDVYAETIKIRESLEQEYPNMFSAQKKICDLSKCLKEFNSPESVSQMTMEEKFKRGDIILNILFEQSRIEWLMNIHMGEDSEYMDVLQTNIKQVV